MRLISAAGISATGKMKVRLSGLGCTLWHAVECRLGRLLDDDEPALAFYRLQALAAVRAGA